MRAGKQAPPRDCAVAHVRIGSCLAISMPSAPNLRKRKQEQKLGMFDRHLLVAGATGTGKTRTLQLLAEGLSAAGESVLLCDVKGDLTGLAQPGVFSEKLLARTQGNGQNWQPNSFPVELLKLGDNPDVRGVPVRISVSDFGPILLSLALWT